jgi:hypothetical protein
VSIGLIIAILIVLFYFLGKELSRILGKFFDYLFLILGKIIVWVFYSVSLPFVIFKRILSYLVFSRWINKTSFNKTTNFKLLDFENYLIIKVESIGSEYFVEYLKLLKINYFSLNVFHRTNPDDLIGIYKNSEWRNTNLSEDIIVNLHKKYSTLLTIETFFKPFFVKMDSISQLWKICKSEMDIDTFESLTKSLIDQERQRKYTKTESILLKLDNNILYTDSTYGVIFESIDVLILLFLNPCLGYVGNYSENKYNFYLSIGTTDNRLSNEVNSISTQNKISHTLKFTNIELNVGFDQSSYIIYIFGNNYNISKSDSLVFRGEEKEIVVKMDTEKIYFGGEFKFGLDSSTPDVQFDNHLTSFDNKSNTETTNSYLSSKNYLTNLNNKGEFEFSILRVTSEKLKEIVEIEDLSLFLYKPNFDNYYRLVGNDSWCDKVSNEKILQFLIKSLPPINEIETYNDEGNDTSEDSYEGLGDIESVYVYLMKDNHTNLYKIGISKNPEFREKTLLSQSPSINLLYKREFFDRDISRVMEKTLHNYFQHKRVRGEWFDLDESDLTKFRSVLGVS